jgi:nitroreductase
VEFRDVVRHRRMVHRFADTPVPPEVLQRILDVGRRGPTAGFAQGIEFLVLDEPGAVAAFWELIDDPRFPMEPEELAVAPPVLVLPIPDRERYLARYAEDDKAPFGLQSADAWPVPFWDTDAAMAAMLMLLAAVDEGLGAWFFGIAYGEEAVLRRFGIPDGLRPIGVVGLGYALADEVPTGSGVRRPRRPLTDLLHRNAW